MDVQQIWQDRRHPAWLGLSARLRQVVQSTAGRTDLITRISPEDEIGAGATACFVPALGEVHFLASQILEAGQTDPGNIDPSRPSDRRSWPHLIGLAAHEAAHAAHTRWQAGAAADPVAVTWATLLEEPRIESALVNRRPGMRRWLRAASHRYHLSVTDGQDGDLIAGRALVLIAGRQLGGVLTVEEVAPVREACISALGADVVSAAEVVITEAMGVADDDTAHMLALGARLADLLEDQPSDQDDQDDRDVDSGEDDARQDGSPQEGSPQVGSPQDGPGEGQRLPCGSWTPGDVTPEQLAASNGDPVDEGDLPAAIRNILDAADQTAGAVAATEQSIGHNDGLGRQEAAQAAQRDREREQSENQAARQKVFGSGSETAPFTAMERPPTPDELDASRKLATRLRTARFRGSQRTRHPAVAPPGRLRSGELMRRSAQVHTGTAVTAEPWQRQQRREIERPTLRVAISSDISGSMERWQHQVASTTWILTAAVQAVQGQVAAAAWNAAAGCIAQPKERLPKVREARCAGGSTGCPESLRALDAALRLTSDHSGVRMLCVVTDGQLNNYATINPVLSKLTGNGVHVLWVTPAPDQQVHPAVTGVVLDPSGLAEDLTRRMITALEQA